MKRKIEWETMPNVINFSGGQSSALMALKIYKQGDIVLFCDTGREHPKTYKFINDFEAFENIPITRISRADGFYGILAKRNFKTLPNRTRRFCTDDLKIKFAKSWLRSQGIQSYNNFIGFRYDEPKRVKGFIEPFKKVRTLFPLFTDGITKDDVNNFWNNKPYKLEIPSILGNCTLCFMKGKNAILAILSKYPELAEPWIEDEERNKREGHTYLPNVTIRTLLEQSKSFDASKYDLNIINPAYSCGVCTQ